MIKNNIFKRNNFYGLLKVIICMVSTFSFKCHQITLFRHRKGCHNVLIRLDPDVGDAFLSLSKCLCIGFVVFSPITKLGPVISPLSSLC